MLAGTHRRLGLIAVVGALGALGFAAPSQAASELMTLDLQVSGQGRVVATIEDATNDEKAQAVCSAPATVEEASPVWTARCPQTYRRDRVVTLKATPVGSSSEFKSWSDDRCPPRPVCKLAVGSDADADTQSVVALFSPQRVVVAVWNESLDAGALTSTLSSDPPDADPAPLPCDPPNDPLAQAGVTRPGTDGQICYRDFPLGTEVVLHAQGDRPAWGSGKYGDECDATAGAECSLGVGFKRIVALNFGGPPSVSPYSDVTDPNDVGVMFRVAKNGTGAGTVRSRPSLDCGDRCHAKLRFGKVQTLVADANPDSRFVRWSGACATSPRCTLAVGPVTRVTAVFDTVGTPSATTPSEAKSPTSRPQQSRSQRRSRSPFRASVGRRPVIRGTHPRRIRFTVAVSAPSSIRAVLTNAHNLRVSSRAWEIPRGKRVLRLAVPRRAGRGTYVLKITARDATGAVKRFKHRVHLRR